MWKEDLFQKKAWFESYTDKINEKLDEFYSAIPDSGLTDREQYLYDMAQYQFKMLYELMDHSKDLINSELMFVQDTIKTKQNADTQI